MRRALMAVALAAAAFVAGCDDDGCKVLLDPAGCQKCQETPGADCVDVCKLQPCGARREATADAATTRP
jgi:hypothetical protein